jgi:hypothetical protein
MHRTIMPAAFMVFFVIAGCNAGPHHGIIRDAREIWGQEGKHVVVEGTVAKEIWQHMMAPTRTHPHEAYFDIGNQQIVIYSKDPITCSGTVQVAGTVVKIEGSFKDPRRKESCTEYHITVDTWKCLN